MTGTDPRRADVVQLHAEPDWTEGYVVAEEDGFAVARPLPRPVCTWCAGTGRREVLVDGQPRVGRCRCQRVPDRVALFNAAKIPARHASCSMESYRRDAGSGTAPAWQAARMWLDGYQPGSRGFVLYGLPGRGKTHLLCAMVRELTLRFGAAARFLEFTHLLAQLKAGFDEGVGEAATLRPLAAVPVLAIDELGKGRKTDWELAVIDELVSRRYNAGGVLLATSNFPPSKPPSSRSAPATLAVSSTESLSERLGERVFSRLCETVRFAPALGEDWRTRRAVDQPRTNPTGRVS